jgi:hypothetical protein
MQNIHFGLRVCSYTKRGVLTQKYAPLHKISHCCFGSVIGMEGLLMFSNTAAQHQNCPITRMCAEKGAFKVRILIPRAFR